MKVIRLSDTKAQEATGNVCRGNVTRQSIFSEGNDKLRITVMNFSPGAANKFNTHTFDQVLYVTEGRGIMATETEEVVVTPGTFIFIPAGERHRHSATKDSAFSHIAVTCPR